MQPFDFSGVVPIDANSVLRAVADFLAMPIVGGLLLFALGITLGPKLLVGLQKLFSRSSAATWDPIAQYHAENMTVRDTDEREAMARDFKSNRYERYLADRFDDSAGAVGVAVYQHYGTVNGVADYWNGLRGQDSDEFRDWLEMRTSYESAKEITGRVDELNYRRARQSWRENDRAQDDYDDDRASATAI